MVLDGSFCAAAGTASSTKAAAPLKRMAFMTGSPRLARTTAVRWEEFHARIRRPKSALGERWRNLQRRHDLETAECAKAPQRAGSGIEMAGTSPAICNFPFCL